jgi:phage shock protein PspC (stress-responsive transcriptional regulator)
MSLTDELERLQALRERGALSEAEYERAKARVLGDAAAAYNATAAGSGAAGSSADAGAGAAGTTGSADASAPFASERGFFRQMARSRTDRWLGGVCGGLGRHTDLPSWAWRLIFCLVTLYFGSGILFYVLLWVFLPAEA